MVPLAHLSAMAFMDALVPLDIQEITVRKVSILKLEYWPLQVEDE